MKVFRILTSSGSIPLIKGQIQYLQQQGVEMIICSGQPGLSDTEDPVLEGARYVHIKHLVRPISIKNDMKALFELIRTIRCEKPDIVHVNTPKASLLGMVAAWLCGVKHRVYTVTGLRFETATGFFRWLLITMERITCACATKVIPEGDGVANTLRRDRITHKPLQKLHNGNINGIDTSYFNPTLYSEDEKKELRDSLAIKGVDIVFTFVGRIVKSKGIEDLIRIYKRLTEQIEQPIKLLLVGDFETYLDPISPEVMDYIKQCTHIKCVGWQNDIRPYLAISDLFIFPSYREGFPNVLLQAASMKLPIASYSVNGADEIIQNNITGYILPVKDEHALEDAIRNYLVLSDAQRIEMGFTARRLVEQKFQNIDVWKATLAMYNEQLNNDVK